MGKQEKKQRHQQKHNRRPLFRDAEEEEEYCSLPSSAFSSSKFTNSDDDDDSEQATAEEEEEDDDDEIEGKDEIERYASMETPSKFLLYQQSVQSPKGDISYLQKLFLMYVGGRLSLHFQEDFCGTALLSTEWLQSDPRRTAVGLDLDLEALRWCMENNINKVGADGYSRINLFHGNVLNPLEAKLVKYEPEELIRNVSLEENKDGSENVALGFTVLEGSTSAANDKNMRDLALPARDIVCAFNYSCCCLHTSMELVSYFKHAHEALSKKGGIFVMDLYGGTSSEQKLRLQRKFANFTYVWEQAEFDIIERKTRISLYFHFRKQQKLRHAFSYSWRLVVAQNQRLLTRSWVPICPFLAPTVPDTGENGSTIGFGTRRDIKYEEVKHFEQQDAWNAYIAGVRYRTVQKN